MNTAGKLLLQSGTYPRTDLLHYFILFTGIFIIFQDLLVENFLSIPLAVSLLKSIDEVFPVIVLLLVISSRLLAGKRIVSTNIDGLLILFILISLLSSITNRVPAKIYLSQFIIYLKGFLMFYLFANLNFDAVLIKKYVHFFFYVSCFILFFGIIDLIYPAQFRTLTGNRTFVQYYGNLPSVKSFFQHPSGFGWYMSYITSFCFAFFLVFNKRSYLAAGICFLLGAFLSMRAKTMAGLIAAIVLSLAVFPAKKRLNQGLLLLAIPACALILFWPYVIDVLQFKISVYITSADSLDTARNALYFKGVEIARDNFPFGAGLGRYGSWISRVYYSPLYEKYGLSKLWGMTEEMPNHLNDTFWAMVIGESGFLGTLVYACILIRILRSFITAIRQTMEPYSRAFLMGSFIMLIESIVESIAYPVYTSPPAYFFIYSTLGMAYALCKKINLQSEKRKKSIYLLEI